MKLRQVGYLCVLLIGNGCASARTGLITPFALRDHQWRQVYADTSYVVSVDIAHVSPGREQDSLAVWYETRHLAMRDHEGKPWNREIIRSLLRCEPLSFKTVLTTIFLENGPPIAQVGGLEADVREKPWRPAGPDTVDEAAMRGACKLLKSTTVPG